MHYMHTFTVDCKYTIVGKCGTSMPKGGTHQNDFHTTKSTK